MADESAAQEPPVINIQGAKVALGPLRRELVPLYHRWMNNWETINRLGYPLRPTTLEQEYEAFDKPNPERRSVWFTIYELASWQPIGQAGLMHIDNHHGTAEFGINIAELAARGKGCGTETARLVLDIAFTGYGLHNVYLRTTSLNIAGQRAYAKAGFKEFGRQRDANFSGGKRADIVWMDIIASEFTSPALVVILESDKQRT